MNLSTYIFLILSTVESGNNPSAVGDSGDSLGMYQLQAAYVQDASEYAETNWKHEDAYITDRAEAIINAYMSRYATEARLGREPTIEDICRIHNGGPNGYKSPSTDAYWQKCKDVIHALKMKDRPGTANYNNSYTR